MAILNPRVDFAFKKLFGSEDNKEILISFINAVVSEKDRIADVVLLNPYNNKEFRDDKISILDIKATGENGHHYNIEMQVNDQAFYNQRVLYYWSRLYTSQLRTGGRFADLKKTISINVLNFNYLNKEPNYHNVFKIMSTKTYNSDYFDNLEFHFIELEKFDDDLMHIKTTLDRWTNFLKRANYYDKNNLPEVITCEPAIKKAFLSLDRLSLDAEERKIYEARLKWIRDEEATLQKAYENGELKGKKEGIREGIEKGIEKTALKMLQKNISAEQIADITGLTLEKIK